MTLPRLYPILDVAAIRTHNLPVVKTAEAMLEGGAQILQWRCKVPVDRMLFQQAERVARLCRDYQVPLVVNDRADIAMLLESALHVGQDDLPSGDARRLIGPEAWLGLSTHNEEHLGRAQNEPIDYVALGPIFSTTTKENPDPEVGLRQLQQWRARTSLPLVAIGGITRKNCLAVLDSGADSVAVISDLLPEEATVDQIRRRIQEWRSLTD